MTNQNFDPNSNIQNRELRVFVSSTFLDMQDERQYLADTVYPNVKKYCQKRGVDLIWLDLRWGITDFQAKRGETLEICLKTIQTSNVFLGLIGYRYGSKPELSNKKTIRRMKREFPFLKEDIENQLSMTEIEMQYGVLREPKQRYTCFCLRSEIMQSEIEKSTTIEESSEDPIEESAEDKEKLERLKEEIKSKKNCDLVSVIEYDSVEEMGALVELFLKKDVVDKLFPAKATWYERQMVQQDFFIERKQKLYVPRLDDYEIINDFMDGPSQYFAITGERGNGKSSLVANWMGMRPDLKFIYCFVDASEKIFYPEDILKLLIAQLNPDAVKDGDDDWEIMLELESENKPKGKEDQPENWYDKYHAIFQRALRERHKANPDERIVLILDGINQISDFQNSKELQWVPKLPKYVKAIFTTWEDDRTIDSLKALGAKTMNVEPLNKEQIREIVEKFLKDRSRSLDERQKKRIVNDKESQSPIVLRTLLDEMCYYGEHENLSRYINTFVDTISKEEFFQRVLKRLEDSFDPSRVSRLLVALVSSHSGLSNEELIGIANSLTKPPRSRSWDKLKSWILPSRMTGSNKCSLLDWKQICYSLDSHFIERGERNYFSHDLIASAAEKRYEAHIPKVRRLIVKYMKSAGSLERQCDEIPWQLIKLDDWAGLNEFLLNFEVLDCMLGSLDFRRYWLELNKKGYPLDAYFDLDISKYQPEEQTSSYLDLAAFGESIGALQISERGYIKALEIFSRNPGMYKDSNLYEFNYATTLNQLAGIYSTLKRFSQADEMFSKALEILQRLRQNDSEKYGFDVAMLLNNLGLLHVQEERFDQGEKELTEALAIYRSIHEDSIALKFHIAMLLLNLGMLYFKMKRYPESDSAYRDSLAYIKELNDKYPGAFDADIARIQFHIGYLYVDTGKYDNAESSLDEALTIYRQLVEDNPDAYKIELSKTLLNLGLMYLNTGRFPEAKAAFIETDSLLQELNVKYEGAFDADIATVQMDLGYLYTNAGLFKEAELYLADALNAFRRLSDANPLSYKYELSYTLLNQGGLYAKTERYPEAENDFIEAIALLKELNAKYPGVYDADIAKNQINLGNVYFSMERLPEAESVLNESLTLYRRIIDQNPDVYNSEILRCLQIRGELYIRMKRYSQAEDNNNEALNIFRQLEVDNPNDFKPAIADVLCDLARTHLLQNRDSEAKEELNEVVNICRSLSESEDFLIFVGRGFFTLAHIYKDGLHDYSRCKELLQESQAAYEKLNELHPGEFDDALNAVRDCLIHLEESENEFSNKE